jgi:hypothetical protein
MFARIVRSFPVCVLSVIMISTATQMAYATEAALSFQPYRKADEPTRALVQKVVAGLGGPEALRRVTTLRKVCAIHQEVPARADISFEGTILFPDSMHARMDFGKRQLTAVRSGDLAYVFRSGSPIKGAALRMTQPEQRTFIAHFYSSPIAVLQSEINYTYRFARAGEAALDGKTFDVLAVEAEGLEITWFINRQDGRIVRTLMEGLAFDFADWRQVEGLTLPFSETVMHDGKVESRVSVQQFQVNPPVDAEALLARPKFWEERYNLPARDEFRRTYVRPTYTTYYYYYYWDY